MTAGLRRAYARRMLALSDIEDPPLQAAFTAVPREAFLGPPPWTVLIPGAIPPEPTADVAQLYNDVLVSLDAARGVNNGSPSLHALMLHALAVRPGDSVLHVGIGGGYYTAMLAELTGAEGQVLAVEIDAALADVARTHLRPWPNVTVLCADGAAHSRAETHRIYVNFAVARPADAWLDRLADGGTLLFPLAVPPLDAPARFGAAGAVLLVTRQGDGFGVRHVSGCSFVAAEGGLAGDPAHRALLHAAFQRGGVEFVRSLRRGPNPPPERSWFWSPEWSLSYDPP